MSRVSRRIPRPVGYYYYNGTIYPKYSDLVRIPAPQVEMWLEPEKKPGIFRRFGAWLKKK